MKEINRGNQKLLEAKSNKKDEFYTSMEVVERELVFYSDCFRNKTVFCNTDNPFFSNFYKYFAKNFKKLGLKALIASCYKNEELYKDSGKKAQGGFYYYYNGAPDQPITPELKDVVYYKEDGDFRSDEVKALLEKSDIVVTNPPFSLFREFIKQLLEFNKKFLIVGNVNALTYKEVFPLIQNEKVRLGENMGRKVSDFVVPSSYQLYGTEVEKRGDGVKIISPNNGVWLTNLDSERYIPFIKLEKSYRNNEDDFPYYDNLNGINIDKTANIPKDYTGLMGVPITFLHKHNPKQFKIVGFRKGDDGKDLSVKGKDKYCRVIIKNLCHENQGSNEKEEEF